MISDGPSGPFVISFFFTLMFSFCIPTQFVFGSGSLNKLSEFSLPGKKALIVTTNGGSLKRLGFLDRLEKSLESAGIESVVFSGSSPNPTQEEIEAGALTARENHCDFVLGFGGGSAMDAAKVIALMATNPGRPWDYCQRGSGGKQQPALSPLPVVCVTTTAGTGSEADNSGMVTNLETGEKLGIGFPSLMPVLSVIDPQLTESIRPRLTAFQGLDAFFHLTEGYLSKKANLFNEMYSLTGIENIAEYLPRAVQNGKDLEARERVSFANTLGGFVMSTGKLLSQHSLEHILSARHPNLEHGAGLVLICRAYFAKLIEKGACPQRFVRLAKAMGKAEVQKPEDFLTALEELLKDCQVDQLTMSEYGIKREDLALYAKTVRSTLAELFENDPISLSEEDCVAIYENSYR